MDPPRLVIASDDHPKLRAALAAELGEIPHVLADDAGPLPWTTVETILAGSTTDELPALARRDAPALRFVQSLYTGLDGFPFSRLPVGVEVAGNVGAYAPFVAEHAIALLLSLAKRLPAGFEATRAGRLRPVLVTRALPETTVLLLGYGSIAQEIAARLRGFGCRVHGLNRTGTDRPGCDRMFPATELRTALASADAIIDCRPLTRGTRGSLGAAELAVVRPAALIVNVGRAGTFDPGALADFLRSHPDAGAAFDPWWEEDFERGTLRVPPALAGLANFVGTPHNAAFAAGARERSYEMAARNLGRFFRGERPLGIVDPSEYDDRLEPIARKRGEV